MARLVALCVGVNKYKGGHALENAASDARDVHDRLRRLGYDAELVLNPASLEALHEALQRFAARLQGAQGVFFFAGHGMQDDESETFLLPCRATQVALDDININTYALSLRNVVRSMRKGGAALSIVLLDACRINAPPFGAQMRAALGATRGIRVTACASDAALSGSGTVIAWACSDGEVAFDGNGGRVKNGLFTKHLLRHMAAGNTLETLLGRVKEGVAAESSQRQVPCTSVDTAGDVVLAPNVSVRLKPHVWGDVDAEQRTGGAHTPLPMLLLLVGGAFVGGALVAHVAVQKAGPPQLHAPASLAAKEERAAAAEAAARVAEKAATEQRAAADRAARAKAAAERAAAEQRGAEKRAAAERAADAVAKAAAERAAAERAAAAKAKADAERAAAERAAAAKAKADAERAAAERAASQRAAAERAAAQKAAGLRAAAERAAAERAAHAAAKAAAERAATEQREAEMRAAAERAAAVAIAKAAAERAAAERAASERAAAERAASEKAAKAAEKAAAERVAAERRDEAEKRAAAERAAAAKAKADAERAAAAQAAKAAAEKLAAERTAAEKRAEAEKRAAAAQRAIAAAKAKADADRTAAERAASQRAAAERAAAQKAATAKAAAEKAASERAATAKAAADRASAQKAAANQAAAQKAAAQRAAAEQAAVSAAAKQAAAERASAERAAAQRVAEAKRAAAAKDAADRAAAAEAAQRAASERAAARLASANAALARRLTARTRTAADSEAAKAAAVRGALALAVGVIAWRVWSRRTAGGSRDSEQSDDEDFDADSKACAAAALAVQSSLSKRLHSAPSAEQHVARVDALRSVSFRRLVDARDSLRLSEMKKTRAEQAVKAGEELRNALATKDYDKISNAVETAEALDIRIVELDQARSFLKTLEAAPMPAAVETGTMSQIMDISRCARWQFWRFDGMRPQESFTKGFMRAGNKQKVQDGMFKFTNELIPHSMLDLPDRLDKLAVSSHKGLLGFCGDRKTTYPVSAGYHVLLEGVQFPVLRDETLIQLCKHLTCNPDARSMLRGWILMCMCIDLFLCSLKFELYLFNFLDRASSDKDYGEYARYCIARVKEALDIDEWGLENNILERGMPSVEFMWHVLSGQSNPYRVSQIVPHRRPWQDSR